MAAGAHAAEGVLVLALHHRVDRAQAGAYGAQARFERRRREHRVAVEIDQALVGRGLAHRLDIGGVMDELEHLEIGLRRLLAGERGEHLMVHHRVDGAHPVGPLWVALPGIVLFEHGMRQIQSGHGVSSPCFERFGKFF
jgi:hypothetical protein